MYIEAVASDMFGAGASGMINPPDPSRHFSISLAEMAIFDRDVYDLLMDLTILYDMAKVGEHSHCGKRRWEHRKMKESVNQTITLFPYSVFSFCETMFFEEPPPLSD